jgi:short subunit dehydrogenase-like uncharacterized protein
MSPERAFLLYGANGYTGELIAREALKRGLRPILAGRNEARLSQLATELGLGPRVFALEDAAQLDAALREVPVVLHAAGPFSRTSRPMADACIRTGRHYLDITGELTVFEALAARTEEAKRAGVMLLPGVGFDVVPSDSLAAHVKARLPSARRLRLAFLALGRASRGTATTAIENVHRGGAVRSGGVITPVPAGHATRSFDFGDKVREAIAIPWGDVSTAFYSTGIPDIEVYSAFPKSTQRAMRWGRWFAPILGSPPIQRALKARIQARAAGPTPEQRARGKSVLVAEAEDDSGGRAVSRLIGPEGYDLTVRTALLAIEAVLRGAAKPGFQTPSLAFGKDFVLEAEGVVRTDVV